MSTISIPSATGRRAEQIRGQQSRERVDRVLHHLRRDPDDKDLERDAEARRGADLAPALPALAFVALAGAGGLVAARRRGRPAVGVLLVAAGAGMALSAAVELRRGILPATCALAGAAVVAVGVETLRRGRGWPALGTTYDRPRGQQPTPGDESDMWEAIDRRIDPTQDAMS